MIQHQVLRNLILRHRRKPEEKIKFTVSRNLQGWILIGVSSEHFLCSTDNSIQQSLFGSADSDSPKVNRLDFYSSFALLLFLRKNAKLFWGELKKICQIKVIKAIYINIYKINKSFLNSVFKGSVISVEIRYHFISIFEI